MEPTQLKVSPNQRYLVKTDGEPFFYLADTVWAAFPNLPLSYWPDYLAYRRRQGFNALQISILPVAHDASTSEQNLDPFEKDDSGRWDFTRYNNAYFNKAEQMIEMAVAAGFVPVLGVVWKCYVPGTNASRRSPIPTAMPLEAVKTYTEFAARRFKRFNPIFFISGDAEFDSELEESYYMAALEIVRATCPEALITMHLGTGHDLPPSFLEKVDFYMYQSGHRADQTTPYTLAQKHYHSPVKRPVVNAEPCYEGHGRVGTRTRFKRFDIRKATWQSLLSGATVGIAYGGHGIWSCHLPGMGFLQPDRKFEPYPWETALQLEGAWDAAYARWLFETYNLFEIEPVDLLAGKDQEVTVSATPGLTKIAIYNPYSYDLNVKLDLSGYRCHLIDLENRQPLIPPVDSGSVSTICMAQFNADSLFLATK
jgi:hypothetical protein